MKLLSQACRIGMLLSVAAGTLTLADPISFPIKLDPFLPGASLVAAFTHGPDGLDRGEQGSAAAIQAPVPPTNASAYAFLTNGAMGVVAFGNPDGSGASASAVMVVNLDFTGTGANTVNFDLTANWGVQGNPILNGVKFSASVQCYSADPVTRAIASCGSNSVNENSTDFGEEFAPGNLSFPIDLSYQFNVDPQHTHFQLAFSVFEDAIGSAFIDAGHTALISIDLAPGVTMDQTNGFLTTPGEVTLPASDYAQPPGTQSTVPEPSMFAAAGLGLAVLIGRRAWIQLCSARIDPRSEAHAQGGP